MRVYIAEHVNIPKYLYPVVEKVTFADGVCWEFCDVEKMEYNAYNNCLEIFFSLNGRTEEVHLYGMLLGDIVAVYPN